jgi:two-component system, chemotaxis family, sensor kinase Cph1
LEPTPEITTPRVLIVDDEVLTAQSIENAVLSQGWEVAGLVDRMEDAVTAAQSETIDAAVLDLNLEGRMVWPVASVLKSRNIPFLFLTGYHQSQVVHPDYEDAPRLGKPYVERDLLAQLARLISGAGGDLGHGDPEAHPIRGD